MTYTLALLIMIGTKHELVSISGLLEYQWCLDQSERMVRKVYSEHRNETVKIRIHCIPTLEGRIN